MANSNPKDDDDKFSDKSEDNDDNDDDNNDDDGEDDEDNDDADDDDESNLMAPCALMVIAVEDTSDEGVHTLHSSMDKLDPESEAHDESDDPSSECNLQECTHRRGTIGLV